jgi:hypothetical protein
MFEHLKSEVPKILPLVVEWAERMESQILRSGRALSTDELEMARSMDVRQPTQIRIAEVEEIPAPDHPYLAELARQTGFLTSLSAGVTLRYGIFLRSDQAADRRLRAHEFRHVAQYECAGSIDEFLRFYLHELLHFGHGPGPLEVDAAEASAKYG